MRNKSHIRKIFCSTLAMATAFPAFAQATGTADIIVTAQKRSESIQNIPLTISAFGSEKLESANATTLENLSILIPSVVIGNVEGRGQVSIRGIGVTSHSDFFEAAVATHIDGFYLSRPGALTGSFLDIERVEVLKGPQGTLYGRNATAGAINIITKKPTDQFEISGFVEGMLIDGNGSAGSDRDLNKGTGYGVKGSLVVNAPLGDNARFRVAVMKVNRDGYFTLRYPDGSKKDYSDANEFYARAQLDLDLGDRVNWLIATDNYWADDRGAAIVMTGSSRPDIPITGVAAGFVNGGKTRTMFVDKPVGNKPRTNAITSTLSAEVSDTLTLRSLTQYRFTKYLSFGEFDHTWADHSAYRIEVTSKAFSQEFQANYQTDKLKGIFGLYYFSERLPIAQHYEVPTLCNCPGVYNDTNGIGKTKAYAAFLDVTYSLTDTLELTGGARYSIEKKGGSTDAYVGDGVVQFAGVAYEFDPKTFKAFTPKVVLNYRPSPDVTIYASAQKGFKSGGYNIGGFDPNQQPFKQEVIKAAEVGAKLRTPDRRMGVNLSGFYYDYKNLQLEGIEGQAIVVSNAGSARIYGLEMDGYILPFEGLRFDLSGAYLNAKFDGGELTNPLYATFPDPAYPNPVQLDGLTLPKAPKWSGTGSVTYDHTLGNGAIISPSFTASYRSKQYFTAFNNPLLTEKGYWWLRASIGYKPEHGNWSLSIYGDNLTNKYAFTSAIPSSDFLNHPRQSSATPPRTFGVRLNWGL